MPNVSSPMVIDSCINLPYKVSLLTKISFNPSFCSFFATKKLICSGGVFLNVKLNQFLWDAKQVKDLWIYPNCGDAGLTVGACLNIYHSNFDQQINKLDNLYKGEEYNNEYIKNILDERSIAYQYFKNIAKETAFYLNKNYV